MWYPSTRALPLDPDGTQLTYSWSFGSGAYAVTGANTSTPTCKYSSAGTKTVTLTVTDNDNPDCCGGQAGCSDKSNSTSRTVTVAKVDKIQYWHGISSQWVDITGTIYVIKNDYVTFKAIPNPLGFTWPTDRPVWGGTSGASGTGSTKSVTFNTLSSSISDYKTVTAECGNTVTVNVIVFDFDGLTRPQDDFAGGSRTRYGVYERVDLECEIMPAGLTPAQVGGLQWSIASGIGSLENITTNGTALYIAGTYAGSVTLRLTLLSGPSKGEYADFPTTIVEPDNGACVKWPGSGIWHVWNTFSIGLKTNMYLSPTDVSFKWIQFSEGACNSQVTGWFTIQFTNFWHTDWGFWEDVSDGNSTTGCRILQPNGDFAELWGYTPYLPYSYGTFLWNIPWRYMADDYTKTFNYMNQEFRVYSDGKAEVRKDNSGWFYNYHGWPSQSY